MSASIFPPKTLTTTAGQESLIEYPSRFPIKVMGAKVDGFVHAIEQIGVHLAAHFPPGSAPAHVLSNHLIVLN